VSSSCINSSDDQLSNFEKYPDKSETSMRCHLESVEHCNILCATTRFTNLFFPHCQIYKYFFLFSAWSGKNWLFVKTLCLPGYTLQFSNHSRNCRDCYTAHPAMQFNILWLFYALCIKKSGLGTVLIDLMEAFLGQFHNTGNPGLKKIKSKNWNKQKC